MITILLRNSICGWMLVPSYRHPHDGVPEVLSQLYGEDWYTMKPSDRSFMRGESIETAKAHVKDVCHGLGIKVSFCGSKGGPTVRLWLPPAIVQPEQLSVDLKWSCWTEDESIWSELAPGVFDKMQSAFSGGTPVTIATAPRKECRYGSVTIEKGKASGYFCSEWDSVEALADTLGTVCDDAFVEMIPYSVHCMEPGLDWEFSVKARKFSSLMRKIDNEENKLLVYNDKEWAFIDSCFRK